MNEIICIYKPQGLTPVQLIEKFRKFKPEYQDVKIGFAGRLDPLAHGLMLLTVGGKNFDRQQYLNLPKTYKFSTLFGIATDSYDYLGILRNMNVSQAPKDLEERIRKFIDNHKGKMIQPYPPFSSKTINGIQMYKLAKLNKLNQLTIPTREVEIFDFKSLAIKEVPAFEIEKIIIENLNKIRGLFRQEEVKDLWKKLFKDNFNYKFSLAEFEIKCSSGTYVRSLANKMGEEFGCGAIAFEINRIEVGDYKSKDALVLAEI